VPDDRDRDPEARRRAGERLAVMGQLAASIAHELRHPLSVMESSLYLARRQLGLLGVADASVDQHLGKITLELRRSQRIIDGLLALVRGEAPRRARVPLAPLVAQALAALGPVTEVSVTVDVAAAVTVEADADQLVQVLVNLLENAQHAVAGRGEVRVEGARADAATWLRVRDDGPGVAPELRHRLFEPLFTTKPRGRGLGLALCRHIVEAHGGTVVLEPSAAGASFLVSLPDRRPSPPP
jgi:two-component system sensor histidine kinase HydH